MRLVYLALGWTLGIVLAANLALRLPLIWLALAILAALLAVRMRHVEAFALLLFALGGLSMATTPSTSDLAAYNGLGGMTVAGVIVGEPDRRDTDVQLRVAADTLTRAGSTIQTSGLVLVDAPPLTDAHYGDRIAATGLLVEPGTSDRFSYTDYLARSGVFSLMQQASVTVTQRATGSDFISLLIDLKTRAAAALSSALPEPQAGLLTGMLLGNAHGIAPDVSDAFAQTGASQVIAISGFNMAVLSGVVITLLKRLRVRPRESALLSLLIIGVYTLFVGANPSVVRAALMSGLLVVGQAIRRQTYLPASLMFAALVLSLLNPTVLWDVGFQLSFFATLGIALFSDPFEQRFDALLARLFPPLPQRLIDLLLTDPLVVSLAALIFTLPLTMLYFGQVTPAVLLINLLILPVQPALLVIGGAATLVAAASPLVAQLLYWIDLLPLSWTIDVVRFFARLPAEQVFISANLVAVFFIVVLGVAMLKAAQPRWSINLGQWLRRRALIGALLASGVAILILIAALYLSRPDGLLHVWLLDMGDADAVLIATPRGAHFLIDGGSYPSRLLTAIGDRLPFTNRSLDALFLSQPDETQFDALPAVLDRYALGVVLSSGQPNLGDTYLALQAKLSADPLVTVRAGYTLTSDDGVRIEALNPPRQPALEDSLDANALVLRLTYGDVSVLLTSNLSSTGQQALLKSKIDVRASVLQIPQQGTVRALDPAFLAAVQPQVIVVQGDHPDAGTLGMFGTTPLYRTDQGGTIDLRSDGHHLWISQEK